MGASDRSTQQSSALRVRAGAVEDREAIADLWRVAGLTRPWNDPIRDLDRKLADSPWGLLVAELDGRLVATAMVGYDGHRGSVYYLAVAPELRGRGFGSALMDRAEAMLLARGCPKINLSVRADNAEVGRFYVDRGYRVESAEHAITYGLRLIPDTPVDG